MQNIDVRFNATSNFSKVESDLKRLEGQALALRTVFESQAYSQPPAVVDPVAWKQATAAVNTASRVYRDAASSSGLMTTQQIRATSEAERYTRALQKQKLSLKDMRKHQGVMREVYRDQLRYQRMTAQYWGTDAMGRAVTDIAIPTSVPRDLDTMGTRMRFFGAMAASAGTQVVNLGKNIQWSGRQLTVGFSYPMALFGAAAGTMAYKTEDAFSRINKVYDVSAKAITDQTLREKELAKVRADSMEMAREVADKYGKTLQSTLEIEQALAATGLKGDSLMQSTKEVQRISALGDIDPSQATDMIVALQTAFRKTIRTGDDLSNTLNFMNATSNATSLSLQDIAAATPRAAAAMAQLGVTAEEMSVLMVSMRESGVDAAEGANALKSATTRILNPVKKAKEIYDSYGISLDDLSKKSGGNLFEFLKLLGAEQQKINGNTKKETARLRAQGVAALFGTYQNTRLTASLVNLSDAYGGVSNQTSRALELMGKTPAQLKAIAKANEEAMMKNPAGQFRRQWAKFQLELQEMGKPFLEAATKILGAFAGVAKFFNGMDDWKKKAVMWGVALLAITGPVVMLTGLFMNLFGQFIKGSGTVAGFFGRMAGGLGLVTKEEKAAELTTAAANKELLTQKTITSTLAQEVNVLTAAYQKATQAVIGMMEATAGGNKALGQQAIVAAEAAAATGGVAAANVTSSASASQLPRNTPVVYQYERGRNAAETAANAAAARAASVNSIVQAEKKVVQQAQAEQKIRQKTEQSVNGASVGIASMSLAMGAMMVTNNDFVNKIAKWLLIGTIVVPAVRALASTTAVAAKSAWSMAAAHIASARAARASAGATAAQAGFMGTLRAGATGLASGLAKAIGPGGFITLGIAAVAGTYYWAWNKGKEAERKREEVYRKQQQIQSKISNSTKDWVEQMGKVAGRYERVYDVAMSMPDSSGGASKQQQLIDYYKSKPEGEDDARIKVFKDLSGDELKNTMLQKFIDLQVEARLSADEAGQHIRAMYIAMGDSADEANLQAQTLIDTWGNVNKSGFNWKGYLDSQMALFNDAPESKMKTRGKDAAEAFWAGMANAKNPEAAQELLSSFTGESQAALEEAWNSIGATWGTKWMNFMKDQGVTNIEQFAAWLRSTSMSELRKGGQDLWYKDHESSTNLNGYSLPWGQIIPLLEDANNQQDRLLTGLNDIVHFGDDVSSVFALPDFYKVQVLTTSYEEQKKILQDMGLIATKNAGELSNLLSVGSAALEGVGPLGLDKMNVINAMNYANGLKIGSTYAEALSNFINKVPADTASAANEAGRLGRNLKSIPTMLSVDIRINGEQAIGITRDAMQNVQSAMADSAMTSFNSRWDSAMDSRQAMWDSRMDAQSRAQEAQQDRFDNRWEKRKEAVENSYQKRIDAISNEIKAEEKADDIRQRIFEKEKQRLQRLAELQNTNIDFNMAVEEGRLDDAAKIMNNQQAASGSNQMDDEQAAAEERTKARIEALEKKNELLEKQRDKEMKKLEQMEERQRKALERMQERRRKALQAQSEADMDAQQRQRDYEEAMLSQRLELFQAYTARNQRDLERWMKEVGLSYDDFGSDVKAKGESWATYFRTALTSEIRRAGIEILSGNMWEGIGKEMANRILKGIGFDGLGAFNKFVKTGDMPESNPETRHDGGVVGSGGGSRGSIPNSYKGLHRSEKMIRAQMGEYVVNAKQAKANHGILDAINNGNGVMGGLGIFGSEPVVPGITGLMSGVMANMLAAGIGKGLSSGVAKRQSAASSSGIFSGSAGMYGSTSFSAEQMRNAAIIASVGSGMGMSSRDLQIGIMTAIAESALRNISYGDRDSLGLFQQRPSQGWGTPEQLTNPEYAAKKFFSVLKGVEGRGDMSPWMAAQTVQRSAFSDGSNYQRWWAAAQAIFGRGLTRKSDGGFFNNSGGGFVSGSGGKHRPISGPATSGLHGGTTAGNPPALDFAGPSGRPVYAVSDGVITSSRDIAGPLASDTYNGDGPYGSFGRMVAMRTNGGATVLYAHLSRRSVNAGQQVKGGSTIGYSGNTGNSSGPHLHFGATNGPYAWLRRGGKIRYDNTPVIAHKGETMLSERLTKKFESNVASGGGDKYDITIDMRGAVIRDDVDIKKAVYAAIDERENKIGRKRVVK